MLCHGGVRGLPICRIWKRIMEMRIWGTWIYKELELDDGERFFMNSGHRLGH